MVPETGLKTFALGDAIIIVIILATAVGSGLLLLRNETCARNVEIFRDNKIVAVYPLDQDRMVEIKGAIGPMNITIQNGAARITSSKCRCGICTKAAPIKAPGTSIICVPNHVTIQIPCKKGSREIDALAR
jgi:hypothetical protein